MTVTYFSVLAVIALVIGYGIFLILLMLLPRKLRSENLRQKATVLNQKRGHLAEIKAESERKYLKHQESELEQFKDLEESRKEDLKIAEEEFDSQEQSVNAEEQRLQKMDRELAQHQNRLSEVKRQYDIKVSEVRQVNEEMFKRRQTISLVDINAVKPNLVERVIEQRRLDSQKTLKLLDENLQLSEKRLATRSLGSALSRYAPEFPWPKPINLVEIKDGRTLEQLEKPDARLIDDLRELTEGVTIELLKKDREAPPAVKLVGGFGICREAARLTLEEIAHKGPGAWSKVQSSYERHKRTLENQAAKMGREAINILRVSGIHEEIQKMVGSLNWRTSYRQNQYLHSLEVARLAGIIASELGVDPDKAKRVGLLHDIGKSIDYRIEGSHAVISGDYADRFGESREICDTVMSHHADLIVETPLAYVLRSADTLSGARPGARVNLEEGYQIRLTAIDDAVRKFPGIHKVSIMNGGREVHVEVNREVIKEEDLQSLSEAIARKIEEEVAFPGRIKVQLTRRFEATAVA